MKAMNGKRTTNWVAVAVFAIVASLIAGVLLWKSAESHRQSEHAAELLNDRLVAPEANEEALAEGKRRAAENRNDFDKRMEAYRKHSGGE